MGYVVTTANQKGGVGKTITTTCLAAILTEQKKKVLIISLDPQRNLDMVAGENVCIRRTDTESLSMLHVLRGQCSVADAIVHTRIGDLVRASCNLHQWSGEQAISAEEYLAVKDDLGALQELLDARVLNSEDNMKVLNKLLTPIRDKYDFILIDTNPSLTLLTLNSLYAADYVLIPAFSEETSTQAILELWDTIRTIQYYNPGKQISVLGILMTKCNIRSITFQRHVRKYETLAANMKTILFDTKIRQSARAIDYVESGVDLVHYDPKGKTTQDYRDFVKEFLRTIKKKEEEKKNET